MKRLSIKVSSLLGRASAFGVAVLGFAACSEEQLDMYGCPTGTFEIKGAVTAESNGAPVAGASIILKSPEYGYQLHGSALTDNKGSYIVAGNESNEKVRIVCTPVAGSGLAADSVDVELKYQGKKRHDWDIGHAESTVNFKLKAKKTNE